jgi:hypothetical protein
MEELPLQTLPVAGPEGKEESHTENELPSSDVTQNMFTSNTLTIGSGSINHKECRM